MLWSSVVLLGLFTHLSAAKPLVGRWDDFTVKHAWVQVPKGWELHGPAPAEHMLDLKIGLKQDKLEELISTLYEVSDPAHHRYGAHLSKEEVNALVAPLPTTVHLVDSWLSAHDIDPTSVHRSDAGEWLSLVVTVDQAERMLGTKYNLYRNVETSGYIVRTMEYSLPAVLHGHVDVVSPTTYFGGIKRMKATHHFKPNPPVVDSTPEPELEIGPNDFAKVASSCARTITPSCLTALYNTSGYTPAATETNSIGITGYLEEYANKADLQSFFKKFKTAAEGFTFTTVLVNGATNDQSDPGVEANLDTQYASGISSPTPLTFYSTNGTPPFIPDDNTPTNTNEPYLTWLNFILAQETIPQTFSTSYGDDEQTVPLDFATSVCNLFAQLGARGSSVLFSSGDDGVGGGDCETNDGTDQSIFQPNFPASCPYVTAVGATTGISPETAADFSAGGFSNYFGQPSYQSSAVSTFLKSLGTKYSGLYNASGRGYPDVSAQGENFQVFVGGEAEGVDGTSCSSPTFSGVVALLNDFLIASGKPPLGFLNPFLYSTGTPGLNDITSGSNPGCNTNGFTATKGWDPVTGLGTPNFGKLQTLVA